MHTKSELSAAAALLVGVLLAVGSIVWLGFQINVAVGIFTIGLFLTLGALMVIIDQRTQRRP